jgi:glutamate dehydrogenase/leucine dehydrogenase
VELFERVASGGHEQVVLCQHPETGLRAIIAIHSTQLGPALGGTRFRSYPTDADALEDVLRLSRAMTYKAAVAGLPLGGGKAVIIGDPATVRTEDLMRTYARFLESLGGRYLTAEDVGTTTADMDLIRDETSYVTGVSEARGGSGDPSPATAVGVVHAMEAVAAHLWHSPSLAGRRVVVHGVGKVGGALARRLADAGASVTVADVRAEAVAELVASHGVRAVPTESAHREPCDVYAPCALGGVLNPATIPELACIAVVGAANNQLADATCADRMLAAGITYAPDYVVNGGGIINISEELAPRGYDRERAYARLAEVGATTRAVLEAAAAGGITTEAAADGLAESRLAAAGGHTIRTFRR